MVEHIISKVVSAVPVLYEAFGSVNSFWLIERIITVFTGRVRVRFPSVPSRELEHNGRATHILDDTPNERGVDYLGFGSRRKARLPLIRLEKKRVLDSRVS